MAEKRDAPTARAPLAKSKGVKLGWDLGKLLGRLGAGPTLAKTTLGKGAVKIDPKRQQQIAKENKSLVAIFLKSMMVLCLRKDISF